MYEEIYLSEILCWLDKKFYKKIKFTNHSSDSFSLNNKKLLFVGVAYKKNVDDCRESPAIQMMEKLDKDQFNISYYDPYIENINLNKKTLFSLNKLNFKQFKNYEAVIITTDHSKINYNLILKNSKIIFDTRGVYKDSNQSKIIHC